MNYKKYLKLLLPAYMIMWMADGDGGGAGGNDGGGSSGNDGNQGGAGGAGGNDGTQGGGGGGSQSGTQGGQDGSQNSNQGGSQGGQPEPLRFYDEQGKPREEILNGLPEDAKAFRSLLQKYNNDQALHQGVQHLQYLASQKGLTRPDPDADEQTKAQHDRMVKEYFNVPDQPDGYPIQKPEDLPDEVWNEERVESLKKIFHKHNAPPELVRELAEAEAEQARAMIQGEEEREQQRIQQANEALKEAFGNEAQSKVEQAKLGLKLLGVEVPENFTELKLDYPTVANLGLKVQELISEDQKTSLARGQGDGPASHEGANYDDRIADIKNNPNNQYYADFYSGDPTRQQRARAEIERLYKLRDAQRR